MASCKWSIISIVFFQDIAAPHCCLPRLDRTALGRRCRGIDHRRPKVREFKQQRSGSRSFGWSGPISTDQVPGTERPDLPGWHRGFPAQPSYEPRRPHSQHQPEGLHPEVGAGRTDARAKRGPSDAAHSGRLSVALPVLG